MLGRWTFFLAVCLGVAARLVLLTNYDMVNGGEIDMYLADEGVVGLMGKHILEGRSLPVFFYGQTYLGALEAYLAAAAFALFGVSLLSLRLVTFACSLSLLWAVYSFSELVSSKAAARWATALVALSPFYFLQWNLKARGGFIEHVFLLFLVLILFWRYAFGKERRPTPALALGLAAGVAFWVNQLIAAYFFVLTPVLCLDRSRRVNWGALLAGFLAGASLLIGYNTAYPLATARTLARKAVTLNRVPVSERDERWLWRGIAKRVEALSQGADKLGIVFGVPPRETVTRLGLSDEVRRTGGLTRLRRLLGVLPILLFIASAAASRPYREAGRWRLYRNGTLVFALLAVTFLVGYVSPRYMLPAYPLTAVFFAMAWELAAGRWRHFLTFGQVGIILYSLLSWADLPNAVEFGNQTRVENLARLLEGQGFSRCYSAGPMYHTVFASKERVILAPLQKNRYPAYDEAVRSAPSICYLFREDQRQKRQHVAFMRLLERKKISFKEMQAGPYSILYDFDPRDAITEQDLVAVRHQERARLGAHLAPKTAPR